MELRFDGFELGLRPAYLLGEGQYEVGVFGRGLADREIVQNGIDFNNLTGMTNDPHTWAVELVSRF